MLQDSFFLIVERWSDYSNDYVTFPGEAWGGTHTQMLTCVLQRVCTLSVLPKTRNCLVHSDQVLVWGFLQTYKNVFSFQGFWFFQLQLRDCGLILSCTIALIPHATLPVTFRLLSKTQRTAGEILEFLRETKYPLNSQKIIFFQVLSSMLLNVQTNHRTLDLPIMLNSVL